MTEVVTEAVQEAHDEGQVIGAIRKGREAEVRVVLKTFKGRRILDLRVWFTTDDGSRLVPSGKGFAIDVSKARDLAELVQKAADVSGGQ